MGAVFGWVTAIHAFTTERAPIHHGAGRTPFSIDARHISLHFTGMHQLVGFNPFYDTETGDRFKQLEGSGGALLIGKKAQSYL
jgi:hypothetical protein